METGSAFNGSHPATLFAAPTWSPIGIDYFANDWVDQGFEIRILWVIYRHCWPGPCDKEELY
jgi:hypothetical protein